MSNKFVWKGKSRISYDIHFNYQNQIKRVFWYKCQAVKDDDCALKVFWQRVDLAFKTVESANLSI